jgi:periplasmic divalent cation tolerance protein
MATDDEGYRFCWVMCADAEEARRIGRAVVEARLAACANVLGAASSIYWWQGKLEQATETPLVLKTRAALVPALIDRVKALHSYECPCVIALPVVEGYPPYLAWIAEETKSAA